MSVQGRLKRYYREVLNDPAQVAAFRTIGNGWETEVYYFSEGYRGTWKSRVLRMYPGANAAEKCTREFRGMRQLFELGYPVPEVFEHSADSRWLSKPFMTMQYINHRRLDSAIGLYPHFVRADEWVMRFAQLMVDLHRIDYHPFLWLVPDGIDSDASTLLRHKFSDAHRLIIDQFQQMWAIPVFDWLEASLPDVEKTASLSVIHNDFHFWNVMYPYVIDWSLIEVSDYRFDLGWTLILAARRSLEQRDNILSEYERLAGHPVDHIEYFEVVGALRRLFDLSVSLGSGADSLGMRPDTVAIMRRQHDHYQQVYDLLCKYTGLGLPEIERLLDTLRGST
ncbi:MAG: phosphotransferase [Chloroflexota bacterium]